MVRQTYVDNVDPRWNHVDARRNDIQRSAETVSGIRDAASETVRSQHIDEPASYRVGRPLQPDVDITSQQDWFYERGETVQHVRHLDKERRRNRSGTRSIDSHRDKRR